MAESRAHDPSIWDLKARAEEQFPNFPNIDVSAPTFSPSVYLDQLIALVAAVGVPIAPITISWHNLTCTVPVEPPGSAIKTVLSAFDDIVHAIRNGTRKAHRIFPGSRQVKSPTTEEHVPETVDVLAGVSGIVEAGKMCLVLGASGSGTSLLLSRIAGRELGSQVEKKGEVLYNGQELLHGIVRPTHFMQYVGQHDEHVPQLTVRHTLEFAARCKWPEWIPHVEVIRRNEVILTAKLLRIERTLDTIVGSDVLRGVSGGERKRVTIAEMLIGMNGSAVVLDNWSKGLDSSTTLSITQSLREFSDQMNCTIISSMQAPSAATFRLFDTVCALDNGRVIYFGPQEQAEEWFLGLGFQRPPRRSVPDFISTVSNPNMRREYLRAGDTPLKLDMGPPHSSQEFAARFASSDIAAVTNAKLEKAKLDRRELAANVPASLRKAALKSNLQNTRHQIKAISERQIRFFGATRGAMVADLAQLLILGAILGSIFWQLPDTLGGATSRGGLVFLGLLFMGLSALAKITEKHEAKHVFLKQKNASFYNAWAYVLTLSFFDVLVEIIRATFFFVPLYLMSGLSIGSSGQRLLYAVLMVTLLSLIMIALTRTLVALFEDPDSAQGAEGLLTMLLILFAGFLKPPNKLEPWLKWIYWINPIHYIYEALAVNEYEDLKFSCDPDELIPENENIPLDLRLCTVSSGEVYLDVNLGISIDGGFRLYYFFVLVGFWVLFLAVSMLTTALVRPTGYAFRWSSVNCSTNSEHDEELEATTIDIQVQDLPRDKPIHFTFSDVKYSVDNGNKVLLNGISGHAVAGKVVLLMGESGAGKSTLLDVCALRKTFKKGTTMGGSICLNGTPVTKKTLSSLTGYCEQNDLHIGEATVKEAILFSAKLRLPSSFSKGEQVMKTNEVIDLLGLRPHSEILVKDLGTGELKLLTMAVEVVASPTVLFLDEPTSGISSASTLVVANALRKIADTGTCVICTVHQPSPEVFGLFDRLLLLKRGGKQVYFGDIGEKGAAITSYFVARGAADMDEDENAADWMLDVIADEDKDFADEWQKSEERARVTEEIRRFEGSMSDGLVKSPSYPKSAGLLIQMREVVRRLFVRYWRLPEYNFTRVTLMLMLALLVGLLYLREIDNTQTGARLSFAAFFVSVIPATLYAQNVIPPTTAGRAVFYREVASGTYNPFAFHFALGSVEIPFTAVSAAVFAVVFYFMVGFDASRFGYFFLATQMLYYFAVMLGVFLSSVTANPALALMLASSFFSIANVLSGFFISKDQMPVWWRWSTWVNPFFYFLAGVLQNQMEGREFSCTSSEFGAFQLPNGFASCEDIPGGDFTTGNVLNGVTSCLFCPIPSGDVLIRKFGADAVNKWVCLVALLIATLVCRVLAGFGFAKLRFLSR